MDINKIFASRKHLESLSTADLISLADDFGIDVPDDLNRVFIIGEILEATAELLSGDGRESLKVTEGEDEDEEDFILPETYNNTCIDVIMRNPAWAYVFWDIKQSDIEKQEEDPMFEGNFLRMYFYDGNGDGTGDFIDMKVGNDDREQYILVPSDKKQFRIDLMKNLGKDKEILSSTRLVSIPSESAGIRKRKPGQKMDVPELVELSGMADILKNHYINHSQGNI